MFKSGDTIIRSLTNKIAKLEQQLAEKDKEIVRLNKFLQAMKIREHNQDKILFAVEQLEKVKEFVNNIYGEYSASVTTNFIDNQIKQLKEGK